MTVLADWNRNALRRNRNVFHVLRVERRSDISRTATIKSLRQEFFRRELIGSNADSDEHE